MVASVTASSTLASVLSLARVRAVGAQDVCELFQCGMVSVSAFRCVVRFSLYYFVFYFDLARLGFGNFVVSFFPPYMLWLLSGFSFCWS